jgi:glycolate oxidase iron-sulfur subunit
MDRHDESVPEPATDARDYLDPTGELREAVGDCVHCGFCLPACPTFQLWGEEMDSPRGRIHLIGQLLDGAQASEAVAEHLDRCLGCMACLTACPSGVRYDRLIGAARSWAAEPPVQPAPAPAARTSAQLATHDAAPHDAATHDTATQAGANGGAARAPAAPVRPLPVRSRRDRLVREAIFATFPYPDRLRLLIAPLRTAQRAGVDRLLRRSSLLDRLAPELSAALRVAPPSGQRRRVGRPPELIPARGKRRAVVGLLTGCVQQVFFPRVNIATARVLAAEGCDVLIPASQGCCGALSLHAGRRGEAAGFARQLIETFERAGVEAIVVNSAGCGSAMKEYSELLAGDPQWADRAAALSGKVADFSEFLAELGPAAPRHPLPVTVAYHDACHLAHAQRITRQPRDLLLAIEGLSLAEIPDAGTCCGSAGIYNLVQPRAASELGERKAAAVGQTGAELLVSGNPGCALQIASALAAAGTPMPVAHLAEVLDASIRNQPTSTLLSPGPSACPGARAATEDR